MAVTVEHDSMMAKETVRDGRVISVDDFMSTEETEHSLEPLNPRCITSSESPLCC